MVFRAADGFFFAGEAAFVRGAAALAPRAPGFAFLAFAFAPRVAFFAREAIFPGFLRFAEPFALRAFTPSRECRMIGFRLELAAFRAGLRVDFFMVVSPSSGS
ncbi:MAG: hypothetical protein ABJC61_11345 [Acidobacteriota bacterium]